MTDIVVHTDPSDESHQPVNTYPIVYWLMLAWLVGIWLIVGFLFSGTNTLFDLNVGYLILVAGALHLVAGVRQVDRNQLGGIFVLGIPTIEVTGTLVIVPSLVARIIELPLTVIEMEIPNEPEKIFRATHDEGQTPPGFKPPIRIPFANPPKTDDSGIDKDDPLHRRSTNEVSFFFRMQIKRGHFFDFYVRIHTVENARAQVEDIGVSVLVEKATKVTFAVFLQKLDYYSDLLEDTLRKATASWGVDIVTARIKLPELSHRLNSALQSIPIAVAEGQAAAKKAEGERVRLRLEGEGRGEAAKAELTGRGEGLKEFAKVLGVTPQDVLGAETARAIASSPSDKIIVGLDGYRQLIGTGIAVAGELSQQKGVASEPQGAN